MLSTPTSPCPPFPIHALSLRVSERWPSSRPPNPRGSHLINDLIERRGRIAAPGGANPSLGPGESPREEPRSREPDPGAGLVLEPGIWERRAGGDERSLDFGP